MALESPAKGEARLWDDVDRGFCVRAYANGRKVYAVKYRVGPVQRWFTIGEHGTPWKTRRGEVTTLTPGGTLSAAARAILVMR